MNPEDHNKAVQLMGREPINPIGHCWEAALYQLLENPKCPLGMNLVHGIGVSNFPGQEGLQMGHAWVEWTQRGKRFALDPIWGVILPAEENMKMGQFSYVKRYTKKEALKLFKKTKFPGPWDQKIFAILTPKSQPSNN
jgi:hypothetical protein